MTTWTADQVRAFLEHTAAHRLHAAFVVLATTGMRRGECLGLHWSGVDLAAGRVSITQTVIAVNHHVRIGSPKTARAREGRWFWTREPSLHYVIIGSGRLRSGCFWVAASLITVSCSADPTVGHCILNGSLVRS
jgi:integrase